MPVLKHSKTWPVSTMTVVQLRVDPKGRTYSSIIESTNSTAVVTATTTSITTSTPSASTIIARTAIATTSAVNNNHNNINNQQNIQYQQENNRNHHNYINQNLLQIPQHQQQQQQQHRHNILNIQRASGSGINSVGASNNNSGRHHLNKNCNKNHNHKHINNNNQNHSHVMHILDLSNGQRCYCTSRKNKTIYELRHRSESIKVDNWDYIYTEKRIDKEQPDNGTSSPVLDNNCNEHGCITGLGARKSATLRQHYYPEGNWGWVIIAVGTLNCILNHGLQLASPFFLLSAGYRFNESFINSTGWLGALSTAVALLISPITIAFCKRKSTRLTAVIGGLITALGCLFTSFASQFHQLFFSYGAVVGIGVGMTRDCSTLMVAQYFKRRREFVEIFIVSGSGLGIAIMSAFIKSAIDAIGWRLGLQAVTGVVFLTFILGTFYRSASLYHPQRRAILHLKNQKRKIKDKNKQDDRPPFFDFKTLKSKTVRILLISTGISAFGINTPIFYLAHQVELDGIGDKAILLQTYLGLAWTLGCAAFGLLVVRNSVECRIARQYLCQTAVFMCGLCILALTAVHGNYHGYVMFVWIYGIFCGGYHYSLKMYTYERVRARNFARTWGFVQCSQAIPIALGVPISGYMNVGGSGKAGYYFSSTCVLVGSLTLFFIDLHRRNISRHKHTRANGTSHLCVSETCPQRRKLSFTQEPDNEPGVITGGTALMLGTELLIPPASEGLLEPIGGVDKPELTCISEEGIADMDLPDNLLDDLDYVGDCITSCNKVENYLMLSEFENNLDAELPNLLEKPDRRVTIPKTVIDSNHCIYHHDNNYDINHDGIHNHQNSTMQPKLNTKWEQTTGFVNNRMISVIEEASV